MSSGESRVLTRVFEANPSSVGVARREVAAALSNLDEEIQERARIIVSELVTNAYLHGRAPITLSVETIGPTVRIEVADRGSLAPVSLPHLADATTGRGLDLVRHLSHGFGVTSTEDGGKVVWAEIGGEDEEEAGPLPSPLRAVVSDGRAEKEEERYLVRLGPVPTALLVAAKSHIDNVVRELSLMRTMAAAEGEAMPAPMEALVRAVTEDFVEPRAEIKRQAAEAVKRGEIFAELEVSLPLSAADAGERYLAALDEADRYARDCRLLTLAPRRSHKAFRQWYVTTLVDHLRALGRGDAPPEFVPFSLALAAELDRLAGLEDSWGRLTLLQEVSAALTAASTVEDVAELAVQALAAHSGVEAARVLLVDDGTLRSAAWAGARPVSERYDVSPLDADLPATEVVRTGRPLFMRSLREIYERFPEFAGYYPSERSVHYVPLVIRDETIGVLALSFVSGEIPDNAQTSFVQAIADVLAQALGRARSQERLEADRLRDLRLLTAQLDILTGVISNEPLSQSLETFVTSVEATSKAGMIATILLLSEDGLHLRHGAAPTMPDFYNDAIDGLAIGPSVGSCGTAAYTGEQVIVEDVLESPLWDDFRSLAIAAGVRACWSTPIFGRTGRLLGTFAIYYRQPLAPSASDLALIDVLKRTVGMAIERAYEDDERNEQLAAERAAALTLQESLLPPIPAELGPVRLAARYRSGDPDVQVGGDWFDAVASPGRTVLMVGDVEGHDLRAAALMGQLRTVARAAASEGQSPTRILSGLNQYLASLHDNDLLATAVVVELDHLARGATVAAAGHPPPILLSSDGGAHWVSRELDLITAPPLSIGTTYSETTVELPPHAVLLLYTDGLIETRTWPLERGIELLRRSLEALPSGADMSDMLDAALDLVPTGSRGDDVAVLAACVE